MNLEDFLQIRMEASEEPSSAELLIFSQIGEWEDMGDVSAKAFAKELSKLPTSVKRLDIHINSPGGSVFEASGIYARLADHRSTKHVYVDGLAASAASIIAMVGHKIFIRANANMMIHLPSGIAMGNADDMRHMATALDSITESMINVYAKRTGQARDVLRNMMANETWMTPQDAIEHGFADEMRGVVKAAAVVGQNRAVFNGVEFDLSRFSNVPAFTATTKKAVTMKQKVKAQTAVDEETPPKPKEDETEETPVETPPAPPAPTPPEPKPAPPPAQSGYEQGIAAERARITALQKLDRPATHAVVAKAIAEGKQPADIIVECMDAMDNASKQSARHADASALQGIPPSDGSPQDDDSQNRFAALLKAKVQNRLKARGHRVMNSRN
jgi:ATP-dependent protease ClpP protease subunit